MSVYIYTAGIYKAKLSLYIRGIYAVYTR